MKRLIAVLGLSFSIWSAYSQVEISGLPDLRSGRHGIFSAIDLSEYTTPSANVFWQVGFVNVGESSVPSWSVGSGYQFEMTVTAAVESKDGVVVAGDHLLSVVDDLGNIRGVASPFQVGDAWVYFLTVFSNETGEELKFKFYDDNYGQVLGGEEYLTFIPNQALGQPDDPVIVPVGTFDVAVVDDQLSISLLDQDFIGSDSIVVMATSIENPAFTDRDTLRLTILDDYEPAWGEIPNQVIAYEGSFEPFDLNNYLMLEDEDAVNFSYEGANLSVSIDEDGRVAVTQPDGWYGSEEITFSATDDTENAFSADVTTLFTVRPPDEAPVVEEIVNQTIGINGAFSDIDLSGFMTSNNPEAVLWSADFVTTDSIVAAPLWEVSPQVFQYSMNITALATAYGEQMEGDTHLLAAFAKADSTIVGIGEPLEVNGEWFYFMTIYSNETEGEVFFKVYESTTSRVLPVALEVNFIPNQVLGDPLDPVMLEAGYLKVEIEGSLASVRRIVSGWSGVEHIRFVATDTATTAQLYDADTAIFEVLDIIAPVLADIPDQVTDEDTSFEDVDVSQYLSGLSAEEVSWEISGAEELSPVLTGSVVSLTVPSDYFGVSDLTVRVSAVELEGLFDETEISFTVNNVNDAPVFTSEPLTNIEVGVLYSYEIKFEDIDSEVLELTVASIPDWLNFFSGSDVGLLYGVPEEGDVGLYTISLALTDGMETVTQDFSIEVVEAFSLTLSAIPDLTVDEDSEVPAVNLDQYLDGNLANDVVWEISGGEDLSATLDQDVITFSLPENYVGEEEIKVKATSNVEAAYADSTSFTIAVENVNDAPYFTTELFSVELEAGQLVSLSILAEDVDTDDITISVNGLPTWLVFTENNHLAIISGVAPAEDLTIYNVVVTVFDGLLSSSQSFTISVLEEEIVGIGDHAITIYPNPASKSVMVEKNGIEKLTLLHMDGRMVREVLKSNQMLLNGISEGSYLLMVDSEEGVFISKLVIRR